MVNILFPGRHHLLTNFQYDYLENLVTKGVQGKKINRILFAVTSADHENTRRNPVPLYLRTMAITLFAKELDCEVKIYPIKDIPYTDKFAEFMIKQIEYQSGDKLTKQNTILACSTPEVFSLFKKLGFDNLPVELQKEKPEQYKAKRPWEVLTLLAQKNKTWESLTHKATQEVYKEYHLEKQIIELFKDSLLTEDADITKTRDYATYSRGMDNVVQFKFNDVAPFVVNGKIVDAGCGTGALINLLAKNFPESDIIGIEATRKFYNYCKAQDYPNPFVFFYRRNVLDQNFKEYAINTFIYSSILHEIYSYISEKDLGRLLKNTYYQLAHKGRIIIRDVVGPDEQDKEVYLLLNKNDGTDEGDITELSTYAKFFQFTKDFARKVSYKKKTVEGKDYVVLRLVDAYEFISKMKYTDNWKSEMHEEFGFWNFERWKKELKSVGFKIVQGSKTFTNPYIVENHYKNHATLFENTKEGLREIDYPPTNMILVGEKE